MFFYGAQEGKASMTVSLMIKRRAAEGMSLLETCYYLMAASGNDCVV